MYYSDVDLTKARTPVDVLRAFVEVYGLICRVGQGAAKKFYLYETFPRTKEDATSLMTIDTAPCGDGDEIWASLHLLLTIDNVIEVSLAYAINKNKYQADLRRHGVLVQ